MYISDLKIESRDCTEQLGNRLWGGVLTKPFKFSFFNQDYELLLP